MRQHGLLQGPLQRLIKKTLCTDEATVWRLADTQARWNQHRLAQDEAAPEGGTLEASHVYLADCFLVC